MTHELLLFICNFLPLHSRTPRSLYFSQIHIAFHFMLLTLFLVLLLSHLHPIPSVSTVVIVVFLFSFYMQFYFVYLLKISQNGGFYGIQIRCVFVGACFVCICRNYMQKIEAEWNSNWNAITFWSVPPCSLAVYGISGFWSSLRHFHHHSCEIVNCARHT